MPKRLQSLQMLPVNAVVLAVGVADLLTTLFWLATGRAIEVNPVMAAVLRLGIWPFVIVKLGTLGAYISVLEWYRRRRNPVFARLMGNVTLIGYVGIYAISFACVNRAMLS